MMVQGLYYTADAVKFPIRMLLILSAGWNDTQSAIGQSEEQRFLLLLVSVDGLLQSYHLLTIEVQVYCFAKR